jgi:hypothetical protein
VGLVAEETVAFRQPPEPLTPAAVVVDLVMRLALVAQAVRVL